MLGCSVCLVIMFTIQTDHVQKLTLTNWATFDTQV
jgi:hypothetical protein